MATGGVHEEEKIAQALSDAQAIEEWRREHSLDKKDRAQQAQDSSERRADDGDPHQCRTHRR